MTTREATKTLSQAQFDAFAALSADDNPIHVDPAFAARTLFGRTVAHGAMLTAMLRAVAAPLAGERRVAAQAAMFPAPSFVDEALRFTATQTAPDRITCAAVRVADGVTTCTLDLTLQ